MVNPALGADRRAGQLGARSEHDLPTVVCGVDDSVPRARGGACGRRARDAAWRPAGARARRERVASGARARHRRRPPSPRCPSSSRRRTRPRGRCSARWPSRSGGRRRPRASRLVRLPCAWSRRPRKKTPACWSSARAGRETCTRRSWAPCRGRCCGRRGVRCWSCRRRSRRRPERATARGAGRVCGARRSRRSRGRARGHPRGAARPRAHARSGAASGPGGHGRPGPGRPSSRRAGDDAGAAGLAAAAAADGRRARRSPGPARPLPRCGCAAAGRRSSWMLLCAEEQAALLVLGPQRRGALRVALLGSVARDLARHGTRPIVSCPQARSGSRAAAPVQRARGAA